MASLTGSDGTDAVPSADRQPEAGKLWERTRNSTSVIVEIVPGSLERAPSIVPKTEEQLAAEEAEEREDDDVLQVPVYVRAEWEVEGKAGEGKDGVAGAPGGEKVAKELGYWVVLSVGRIAS